MNVVHPYSRGIEVCYHGYDGWIKPDGTWDLLPDTEKNGSAMGIHFIDHWRTEEERTQERKRWERVRCFYNQVPEKERIYIQVLFRLPFTNVLEVDNIGDHLYQGPHLYCRWDIRTGPFETDETDFYVYRNHHEQILEYEQHRPLFSTLAKKQRGNGYKPTRFLKPLPERKLLVFAP